MVAGMASEAETRINLTALKRKDPYISSIIDSATQVAVYTFNHISGEWEKTEVEGTLFVYSRIAPPTSGFTIMNRLSMDNLTESLTSDVEFQNQNPFLLYRNAKMQIYGLWFYDMYDCTRIGQILVDLSKKERLPLPDVQQSVNNNHPLPSPSSTGENSTSSSETGIDEELKRVVPVQNTLAATTVQDMKQPVNIMDLLGKAKDRYDKNHSATANDVQSENCETSASAILKPVPVKTDTLKKFSVASLFGQHNIKRNSEVGRPSSADIFEGKDLENSQISTNIPSKGSRRYAARSLSLSFTGTNEQLFDTHKNIVNGAISVEELESPVLGKPSNRARYHSTSEGVSMNMSSPRLPLVEESAFNKLLGTRGITTKTDNHVAALPHFVNKTLSNVVNNNLAHRSITTSQSVQHKQPTPLHRSMSNPGNFNQGDRNSNTSSFPGNGYESPKEMTTVTSSHPALMMPTLHEHHPPSNPLLKSMSVASGLAQMPYEYLKSQPGQLTKVLHESSNKQQVKLLSPTALQASKSMRASTTNFINNCGGVTSIPATVPLSTMVSTTTQNNSILPSTKKLISPGDFEHSTVTPQKAMELRQRLLPPEESQPLDKIQFANTLVHLLQTDQSFVETIHKAYLNSFQPMSVKNDKPKTCGLPFPSSWK